MHVSTAQLRPGRLANLLAALWIKMGLADQQKYRDKGWDSYAERIQFKLLKARLAFSSRKQTAQLQRLADDLRTSRTFNEYCRKLEAAQKLSPSGEVTFKHSGNAGDVIYALPAIRALSRGRPAKFFLKLDMPINSWTATEHPLGQAGLTTDMARMLKPLLEHQTWLTTVQTHQDEVVNYDLDIFRKVPNIVGGSGSTAHWYFWLFGVSADLSQPWLEVRPPPAPGKKIVLARSSRYRNPGINYEFLRARGEIDFVGTRSEFAEMLQVLPQLRHVECSDFLQLARIIKSARFFIGNQSFPYAIAEALKVPRLLEVCPQIPDVIPTGAHTGEAFFQPNFERLVAQFWEQTA